jgi:hypothetical protein
MGDLKQFDEWAAAAQKREAPRVDVTSNVVRTIQRLQPRRAVEKPEWAIAATAVIAASIALVAAWHSWQTVHDPLVQWFNTPDYLTMR